MDSVSSDNLRFQWGKKRGIGGANKDIRFYESFIYDGESYSLYDSVYLFKSEDEDPYIGKILKIWEQADLKKRIKVLWFFLPCEIQNQLAGYRPSKTEVFLASGEGAGLANVNPLEAITGKCNVVCISKDRRNVQPSPQELASADYVFLLTFDVGSCRVSDVMPDRIADVEVTYLLNMKKEAPVGKLVSRDDAIVKVEPGKPRSSEATGIKSGMDGPDHLSVSVSPIGDVPEVKHGIDTKSVSEEKPCALPKYDSKEVASGANVASPLNAEARKKSRDSAHSNVPDDRMPKRAKLPDDSSSKPYGAPTLNKKRISGAPLEDNAIQTREGTPALLLDGDSKRGPLEITQRPDTDRSKWFKGLPWEERIQKADEQNTLVLLDNLDPRYNSEDVEDIIYHAFNHHCTAKVIPHVTYQDCNYGQAYVIFKTPDAADQAVRKIFNGCLMLSNGRPLVGTLGMIKVPQKKCVFAGHLVIDKIKLQMQREELRKAVSTSHCSQPNTIEYEMALDWILAQEKSSNSLSRLHKEHGDEIMQTKRDFKKG